MDMIFVVDGSDSISNAQFKIMLKAMVNTVELPVEGSLRFGVVVYSGDVDAQIYLSGNKPEVSKNITSHIIKTAHTRTKE